MVSALPRSSSPAVSLEGTTLMHRLVNLRTKRRFSDKKHTICHSSMKHALMSRLCAFLRSPCPSERNLMFTEGETGRKSERGIQHLPDGLAGGFVFDSGGEGGVGLILNQEGQWRLRCVLIRRGGQNKNKEVGRHTSTMLPYCYEFIHLQPCVCL